MDARDVQPFLPTIERARAPGLELRVDRGILHRERSLLEEEPVETERWLALIVRAKVVSRDCWSRESDVSAARLATLLRERPAVRDDFTGQIFVVLEELRTPEAQPCSHCSTTPGRALCGVCGGEGRIFEQRGRDRVSVPCGGCQGEGSLVCSSCDGSAWAHRVMLEHGEDSVHALDHVFLPPLPRAVEAALRDHLERWSVFPDALKYDLYVERGHGAPYRSAVPTEPQRWTYLLGDVADEARAHITRLGRGELVKQSIEAATVPVLVAKYRRKAVAAFAPTETGGDVAFAGFE